MRITNEEFITMTKRRFGLLYVHGRASGKGSCSDTSSNQISVDTSFNQLSSITRPGTPIDVTVSQCYSVSHTCVKNMINMCDKL